MISTRRWKLWPNSKALGTALVQGLDSIRQPTWSYFRYLPPAYLAGGIYKELGKAAGIASILAGFGKKQVIGANGFDAAIGKERKREACFAGQFARFFRSVRADGDRENA